MHAWKRLLLGGAIAIAYFLAAKFGLSLAFATKQVTAVWPPSALSLVALFVFGRQYWPAITLGAFAANALADEPPLVALGIAFGNTAEAWVGLALLRRGGFEGLQRLRDVLTLTLVAAFLSPLIAAAVGVISLCLGEVVPWSAAPTVGWIWWLGDAMGDVVFAPILLSACTARLTGVVRRAEGATLCAALTVTCQAIFNHRFASGTSHVELEYLVFPFAIWAAVRFPQAVTSAVVLMVSATAIWGSVHDRGPFSAGTLNERLAMLQTFTGIFSITALSLGAATAERRAASASLSAAKDELEARVAMRTHELQLSLEDLRRSEAERSEAHLRIASSLREKEVMLKEIHHRVKNNLQVVSSLLFFQSKMIEKEADRALFKQSQDRVRSMALIHEKLYGSQDLSSVDFADYVRGLTATLFHSYAQNTGMVRLYTDLEAIFLDVDSAIPCGLILNELVSNALKHAFPAERSGQVVVTLRLTPERNVLLRVADDGVGFPASVDEKATHSLGLRLVQTFTRQLEGTFAVRRETGTACELSFVPRRDQLSRSLG